MATIFDWPTVLKNHNMNLPYLEKLTASAGVSIMGQERVVAADAGRWRFRFQTMIWNKRAGDNFDKVLAFRGLFALTQNRAMRVRIPFFDPVDVYGMYGFTAPTSDAVPHSDSALFSDGSGYSGGGLSGTTSLNASAGDTSVTLTTISGVVPQVGQYYSDGNWAYIITGVTANGGSSYTLSFLPRLRDAISSGSFISFTKIYCTMRLVDDGALAAAMTPTRASTIDLDFAEALT